MGAEHYENMQRMGIQFGEPVEGDPIFISAILPKGWRKQPTEHPMWSDLLDDKGRKRAAIFYKAAFYDRSAQMRPASRISVHVDYDDREKTFARVMDGATVLFQTEDMRPDEGKDLYEARNRACTAVREWLEQHLPLFNDPCAYWDVEDLTTFVQVSEESKRAVEQG